jgi:hypothetical protein
MFIKTPRVQLSLSLVHHPPNPPAHRGALGPSLDECQSLQRHLRVRQAHFLPHQAVASPAHGKTTQAFSHRPCADGVLVEPCNLRNRRRPALCPRRFPGFKLGAQLACLFDSVTVRCLLGAGTGVFDAQSNTTLDGKKNQKSGYDQKNAIWLFGGQRPPTNCTRDLFGEGDH